MSLVTYQAEYEELTRAIEALQAEQRRVREEAETYLQRLAGQMQEKIARRLMVEGAIEALTPKD